MHKGGSSPGARRAIIVTQPVDKAGGLSLHGKKSGMRAGRRGKE